MRKTIFIVLILVTSLLFISCTRDNEGNEPIIEEDIVDNEIVDDEIVDDDTIDDVEDEPIESEDDQNSDEDESIYSIDDVEEMDLEIELVNEQEIEYDFDRSDNEAKVERENNGENLTGQQAMDEVFKLMENIEIDPDNTSEEMMEDVLGYLGISRDEVEEFKLEFEFLDGRESEFNFVN